MPDCHVCMHVGRKLRKWDLFPRSRLQANAYSSYSLWSSIHLGLVHAYPDIFESANFSLRIQKFPRPHVSVFKSNLPVHTYPDSLSVRQLICKALSGSCENHYRQSSSITVSLTKLSTKCKSVARYGVQFVRPTWKEA